MGLDFKARVRVQDWVIRLRLGFKGRIGSKRIGLGSKNGIRF